MPISPATPGPCREPAPRPISDQQSALCSRASNALRRIDTAFVEQRHRLGAEYHHEIVPRSQIGEQLCLGGGKSTQLAWINEGMKQNAGLNSGLTVTYLPEYIIVQVGKSNESRLKIILRIAQMPYNRSSPTSRMRFSGSAASAWRVGWKPDREKSTRQGRSIGGISCPAETIADRRPPRSRMSVGAALHLHSP
jgi:hypothetical protein